MIDIPHLAPELLEEMARDNPHGVRCSAADVQAWFQYVCWPRFKTYNYRNRKRAILRWWARSTIFELRDARAAAGRAANEEMLRLQQALEAEAASAQRRERFSPAVQTVLSDMLS